MNKIILIGIMLIAILGASIAGEVITQTTATKDITIEYATTKIGGVLTKGEMIDFNNLKYEVIGNTIVLNKKGVFNGKEILIDFSQDCLKSEIPFCEEKEVGDCANVKEVECIEWSNYNKDYFVKRSIKRELEKIKSVQVERANRVKAVADTNGKIIIGELK